LRAVPPLLLPVLAAAVVALAAAPGPAKFPVPGGGLLSFLPPLLAIGLALLLRQVVPALLLGVLAGTLVREGFHPGLALARLVDHDLVRALAEPGSPDHGHLKIVLFTLLLGGMVGLASRSGGAAGLVSLVARRARTRQRGQLAAFLAGLAVFFDDYANTLVVGPSLRPLTDRLGVSREKLAFIVDATAAPVASLAVVSTWIGYEVGLIGQALPGTRLAGHDPYGVFLASLPYRFYAWLMLAFVGLVGFLGRDLGPMAAAERRAARGAVLRPGSVPLARTDRLRETSPAGPGPALLLAGLPILAVVGVTFAALWLAGRASLAAAGDPAGTLPLLRVIRSARHLGAVLGAASCYDALLYGSAAGAALAAAGALALGRLNLAETVEAFLEGMRSMLLAVVILVLAWMIGGVCADLGTARAAVGLVGGWLPARLVPATVFLLSAGISFATGSSWSTMAVLVPVALPLADRLATLGGWAEPAAARLLVATTGSVLTGAVFGDHCSPLSDTTVMSSMAAACDHVDHVRTQMPYALLVAAVSLPVGDLAVGFGVSPWLGLLGGAALLFLVLRFAGRSPAGGR